MQNLFVPPLVMTTKTVRSPTVAGGLLVAMASAQSLVRLIRVTRHLAPQVLDHVKRPVSTFVALITRPSLAMPSPICPKNNLKKPAMTTSTMIAMGTLMMGVTSPKPIGSSLFRRQALSRSTTLISTAAGPFISLVGSTTR